MNVFKHFYNLRHDHNSFCQLLHYNGHLENFLLCDDNRIGGFLDDAVHHIEGFINHIDILIHFPQLFLDYCLLHHYLRIYNICGAMLLNDQVVYPPFHLLHLLCESGELVQLVHDVRECLIESDNLRYYPVYSYEFLLANWHLHNALHLVHVWYFDDLIDKLFHHIGHFQHLLYNPVYRDNLLCYSLNFLD